MVLQRVRASAFVQGRRRRRKSERKAHRVVLGQEREVGREEADAARVRGETVQDGVRDGHAVVRRGTAAELVEDDERARRCLRASKPSQLGLDGRTALAELNSESECAPW